MNRCASLNYCLGVILLFSTIAAHASDESQNTEGGASVGVHRFSPIGTLGDWLDQKTFLKKQEWAWRRNLLENGYDIALVYTGDSVTNTAGGLRKGHAYLGNVDLMLTIDTTKAGFWSNGTLFAYGLYNFSTDRPSEKFVGDLQGINNIDAPRLFKLFELWYEHRFWDDGFSVRGGLYNVNAEFNVTDYGAVLINGSFGMEPAMALNTTVSAFPLAAPGVRIKWNATEHLTLQSAVVNGNPGDEDTNPHGVYFAFNKKHGHMVVTEAQLHGDISLLGAALPSSVKVGAWTNSRIVADTSAIDDVGNPVTHAGNHGLYAVVDQMIFREKEEQGLGMFAQFGQAPGDRNILDRYWGGGLNYKGLLPTRDNDILALGFGRALFSDDYHATGDFDKFEDVMELTYRFELTESVALQPDLQIIHNPSGDPTLEDAKVVTIRTQISF